MRDHGSLVVKVSDRAWRVMSSSRVPLKIHRVGERCTLNLLRAQTSSHMKLFAAGQAYVALGRVKSLECLLIQELDYSNLTCKRPSNNDALQEMNRLRNLSSDN
ncbi:hypothetical protein TNCV_3015941 [Trichonephila clavipes]|nr:hypothetical protein TNCV_3015941 [Trichonephila clavipes]